MIDATSELTAKSIKKWYSDLIRVVPNIKIGIFVNKMDCEDISQDAIKIAKDLALEQELPYFAISVKNGFCKTQIIEFLDNINM